MQLSNHGHVVCHWKMAEEVKPVKKVKLLTFSGQILVTLFNRACDD